MTATATPARAAVPDPRQAIVDEIARLDADYAAGEVKHAEALRAAEAQLEVAREELRVAQERAGQAAGESFARSRRHEAVRNELLAELRRSASPAIDDFAEELGRLEQWGIPHATDQARVRAGVIAAQRALHELRESPMTTQQIDVRIDELRRAIPVDGIPPATLESIRRRTE